MRYVVTGGAGFIGSHLVEHLVGQGQDVVVLDDFSTGKRENIARWLGSIELVEGSITDPGVCARALAGADYVLHQAALPSVPRSVKDPVGSHAVNATGTLNVLIAARDAKVKRVVYAASSSAYGNTPELPKREEMVARPLSPYAVAKLSGEQYCRAFHASFGLPTVALRYFNVFGPRQDPTSQYAAVVPKFITMALAGESPTIFGDGNQTRDFTYVANVVRANLLACEAGPAALGEVFNVGCGERMSVNDLWSRIRELVGAEVDARHEPSRTGDVRDSLASLDRIRSVLGYEPTVGVGDGLARLVTVMRGERRKEKAESRKQELLLHRGLYSLEPVSDSRSLGPALCFPLAAFCLLLSPLPSFAHESITPTCFARGSSDRWESRRPGWPRLLSPGGVHAR